MYVCCLLTLGPPIYTRFPYTTLFRSITLLAILGRTGVGTAISGIVSQFATMRTRVTREMVMLQRQVPQAFDSAAGDRKSTRLNSSHVAISYAGFCLKKKKIIKVTPQE